jgi:hypothetical protein
MYENGGEKLEVSFYGLLDLPSSSWRQHDPLKHRYFTTSPHSIITQTTTRNRDVRTHVIHVLVTSLSLHFVLMLLVKFNLLKIFPILHSELL